MLNVTGTMKSVLHLEHLATRGASLTGTFPALHKAFAKHSPAGDESQLNEESGVILEKNPTDILYMEVFCMHILRLLTLNHY